MRSYRYGPSLSLDGYNVGLNTGETLMLVNINIELDIEPDIRINELCNSEIVRLKESAVIAVENALRMAEDNGFNHPCAGYSTIEVQSVI
jgi:hypothetical protein